MSRTIEDFMPVATEEQKSILLRLSELAEEEYTTAEIYHGKLKSHQRAADSASELKDGQYARIIREDAGDLALIATVEERGSLAKIKSEMKKLMISAVRDHQMGDLGIIQRMYEHYVGEPIPRS